MRSARRPTPPPLEANDQAVTAVITVGWAIALVILLILHDQLPSSQRWWSWTCLAGVAMGLFGLWYVPRLKRGRARKAQQRGQLWSSDSKTVSSTDTPGRSTRS
jgi:hypothetical protein